MLWRKSDTVYGTVVLAIAITCAVEFIGAMLTNSIGLYSDALHLLADLAPVVLGWAALRARSHRLERLTTLLNATLLTGVGALILKESLERFVAPQQVNPTMLFFAAAAVVGNGIQAYVGRGMHGIHHHAHTGHSQVLHLAMDFAASGAVFVGALVLWATGYSWPDPAAAATVMVLSVAGAFVVAREYRAHHHHH